MASVSGSSNVIVWCHQSRNLWLPFDPSVSNYIEQQHASLTAGGHNGSGIFKIDHLSMLYGDFEIDLKHKLMKEIYGSMGPKLSYPLERCVCPFDSLFAKDATWEFEGDHHQWIPYDIQTAQLIEDHVKRRKRANTDKVSSKLDLSKTVVRLPYIINIKRKSQRNIHTRKERQIRRASLPESYICGNGSISSLFNGTRRRQRSDSIPKPVQPTVLTNSVTLPKEKTCTLKEFKGSNPDNAEEFLKNFTRQIIIDSVDKKDGFKCPDINGYSDEDLDIDADDDAEKNGPGRCSKDEEIGAVGGKTVDEEGEEDEECAICFEKLTDPSAYGEDQPNSTHVVELIKCHHRYHKLCTVQMYKSCHMNGYLECPSCKRVYGDKVGNCPAGTMMWNRIDNLILPGHEHCNGAIEITYIISAGTQAHGHPNPGTPFKAKGFPRRCYLPDSDRGRTVLKLLMEAFKRRLVFTVGTSSTTGESNTVIWNDIHHKTSASSNLHGHGYPDPNYLDNVTLELEAQGVTEDCLHETLNR